MANYGKCENCKNVDDKERNGYKWFCTWYGTYEDPEIIRDCPHDDEN